MADSAHVFRAATFSVFFHREKKMKRVVHMDVDAYDFQIILEALYKHKPITGDKTDNNLAED